MRWKNDLEYTQPDSVVESQSYIHKLKNMFKKDRYLTTASFFKNDSMIIHSLYVENISPLSVSYVFNYKEWSDTIDAGCFEGDSEAECLASFDSTFSIIRKYTAQMDVHSRLNLLASIWNEDTVFQSNQFVKTKNIFRYEKENGMIIIKAFDDSLYVEKLSYRSVNVE